MRALPFAEPMHGVHSRQTCFRCLPHAAALAHLPSTCDLLLPIDACLPQALFISMAPEEVPLPYSATLPSCGARMVPFALLSVRWLAALLLVERRTLGGGLRGSMGCF